MITKIDSTKALLKNGVYQIKNLKNGKIYIGSTTQGFFERFDQHIVDLNNKKHKNIHLQNAWNVYGEDTFEFSILEYCLSNDCLNREQYYLDSIKSWDKNVGYNINKLATGTPELTEEVINKRTLTFTNTNVIAMSYYQQIKSDVISLEEVPKKYKKLVEAKLNQKVWNKGLTKDEFDYSYLKVKKTKTKKYLDGRKQFSETRRNTVKNVLVYNYKGEFLKSFRSVSDIVDYTKNPQHDLPLILRTFGRKGRSLSNQNISNTCLGRTKHYKGLIFRYEDSIIPVVPLIPSDIHPDWKVFKIQNVLLLNENSVETGGKIGESCDANTERVNLEIDLCRA